MRCDRLAAAEQLDPAVSGEVQSLLPNGGQITTPGVGAVTRFRMFGRQALRDLARGHRSSVRAGDRIKNGRGDGIVPEFIIHHAAFFFVLPHGVLAGKRIPE